MSRPDVAVVSTRRSIVVGIVLVFAFTWPIELGLAAQSRGLLPFTIPDVLGILIGYAIVAATLVATALEGGAAAVRRILRRFLVWRIAPRRYAVALLVLPGLYLAALAINVALGGTVPDFGAPYVTRFVPAGLALWLVVPSWLLFEILTNGEEIAWRAYLLARLQARYRPIAATVAVVTVAAVWHLPKFLVVPPAYDYPAWLLLADLASKAVLATWLWNRSRGSLLLLTLFHAAGNTAALSLPVLPGAYGDLRPWLIAVALEMLAAMAVVVRDPSLGLSEPRAAIRRGAATPAS